MMSVSLLFPLREQKYKCDAACVQTLLTESKNTEQMKLRQINTETAAAFHLLWILMIFSGYTVEQITFLFEHSRFT